VQRRGGKLRTILQHEVLEQVAGEGFRDADVLLSSLAGRGDLPPEDRLRGERDHGVLDRIAVGKRAGPQRFWQGLDAPLLEAGAPKQSCRLLDLRLVHGFVPWMLPRRSIPNTVVSENPGCGRAGADRRRWRV
jgi:hypothetical protein